METVLGVLATVFLTFSGLTFSHIYRLEKRFDDLETENNLLWLWVRRAQDAYYRHTHSDAPRFPDPPKGVRGTEE